MEEPDVSDKLLTRRNSGIQRASDKFSWTTALAIIGLTIVSCAALLSGVLLFLHNEGYLVKPHQPCAEVESLTTTNYQTTMSQSTYSSFATTTSMPFDSHSRSSPPSPFAHSPPSAATSTPSPRGNSCRACAKEGPAKLLGTANLRTGDISFTPLGKGVVSLQDDVMDPTPANHSNCDVRALLRINVPENSVIRFHLVHDIEHSNGTTFHIGDSHYSDGWSRDCENHSTTSEISARDGLTYSDDCAEMHSFVANPAARWMHFYATYLPGWWQYTTEMYRGERTGGAPWLELTGTVNAITPNMTMWAGHRYMAANNHASFQVCYDNDMVFLPKQPTRSPNNDIYFGLNRVVKTALDRFGSGLCEASLYLIESC